MSRYIVAYSYRHFEDRAVEIDSDDPTEDDIRDALKQEGIEFSEDEEFSADWWEAEC